MPVNTLYKDQDCISCGAVVVAQVPSIPRQAFSGAAASYRLVELVKAILAVFGTWEYLSKASKR